MDLDQVDVVTFKWDNSYNDIELPEHHIPSLYRKISHIIGQIIKCSRNYKSVRQNYYALATRLSEYILNHVELFRMNDISRNTVLFVVSIFHSFERVQQLYQLTVPDAYITEGKPTTVYEYFIMTRTILGYRIKDCLPYMKYINMDENPTMRKQYEIIMNNPKYNQKRLNNKSAKI